MDTQFWLIQAFNGISYGALLFLLASGLTLIFGVMRIVNLAHGSYFLVGGYVALSVIWTTGSWLLALPAAALALAVVGLVMERVFLRPLGFDPLRQVLATIGFAFLFQQAALDIWGGDNLDITPPDLLKGSTVIGGLHLPVYRIFMIGMAAMMGAVLQAPLAALMALLELTHNPNIILPGMLAVVVSGLTTRQLCRCDGFFISVTRHGLHPLQQPLMQALSRVSVPAVMERSLVRTPRLVTRDQAQALLESNPVWVLIERSTDDKPTLALKAADLARWLMGHDEAEAGREGDESELLDLLEIPGLRLEMAPIHLQATLSEAFDRLNDQAVDALYVEHGHRPKQKRISGIITRGAIERYYRFDPSPS